MRLWVVIAVLLGVVSYGSTLFLPLNGAIPLPLVIGPGPIIVALLWILKGVAIAAFFILTRKLGPVLGGGAKIKYAPAARDPYQQPTYPVEAEEPAYGHAAPPLHDHPATEHPPPEHHVPEHPPPEHHAPEHPPPEHHAPEHPPPGHHAPEHSPPGHHAPEHPPPVHHAPEHHPPPHHAPPAHEHTVEDHAEGVSSYSHLRKRSLEDLQTEGIVGDLADESLEEAEEMLWNTALKWDPTGCSMKLLCHLQELPQGNATMEESVLAYLFSHAPQQYCLQSFPACPMSGGELRHLLQQI